MKICGKILAASLAAIAAVPLAGPADAAGLLAAIGRAEVVKGDTISVGKRRIRLQNVHFGADGSASEAAGALTEMLSGVDVVCFDSGDRLGGAIVGRCDVRGVDLGRYLIELGLAAPCPEGGPAAAAREAMRAVSPGCAR